MQTPIQHLRPIGGLFLLLTIVTLISRMGDWQWLEYIVKPLLMPVLVVLYWKNIKPPLSLVNKSILAALFFSWLGDLLLMFQAQQANFFIFGLVAFLLAHLAYIVAFFNTNRPRKTSELMKNPWLTIPFLIYCFGFVYYLKDDLGGLLIPVSVYAVVITTMAMMAVYRYGKVPYKSYRPVFAGALFFVLSDSLIALNKFSFPIYWAGVWIMATYCLAQYLIVVGMIRQERVRDSSGSLTK